MKKKMWGGRFTTAPDKLLESFSASIDYDRKLYKYDIAGSRAHAQMLARQGVISAADAEQIVLGLTKIEAQIDNGEFEFSAALEDIHMNIEQRLTEAIGEAGARLHTGRSRNDQVALDIRLYLRDAMDWIESLLGSLQVALVRIAEANIEVVLPGYTHLQRAQPVLLAHHLLAYQQMFARDSSRLAAARERMNYSPLGSAALAGTPFPLDRESVAAELGFAGVTRNSLDAVSDRDFSVEFLAAASIIMMHLSRFSEELIIWSSAEYGFVEISDAFTTGSSIMPQKKNPDVCELVRGKTGRVYGDLMALLTVLKGLPLAYNRDMQEDKEPVFDAVDTVGRSLEIFIAMLPEVRFQRERMLQAASESFSNATDVADYLVGRGVSFRQAHHIVGQMVAHCIAESIPLEGLSLEQMQQFYPDFNSDIYQAITIEQSVAMRLVTGGTSPVRVKEELARLKAELGIAG